jgi:serine/threonine-protein kinase RsbW
MRGTVDDVIAFYAKGFGDLDESSHYELKVVLNELLINAIRHGCKSDPNRSVTVEAHLSKHGEASVVVEDDGDGYDTRSVGTTIVAPRMDAIEDIAESGRGLAIVRSLCEYFAVNAKGNKVAVRKKLTRQAS